MLAMKKGKIVLCMSCEEMAREIVRVIGERIPAGMLKITARHRSDARWDSHFGMLLPRKALDLPRTTKGRENLRRKLQAGVLASFGAVLAGELLDNKAKECVMSRP